MSVTREYESADSADEYAEIEKAVMESARGRWFLAEHSRRERAADTALILAAIRRLEAAIAPRMQSQEASQGERQPATLAPENMRYFRQDEDIFEPVPGTKVERPALRVIAAAASDALPDVPAEKSATRVTIKRLPPDSAGKPDASPAEPQMSAAIRTEAAAPAAPTAEVAKPRIVVVRRPSSDQLAIPLANPDPESAVA